MKTFVRLIRRYVLAAVGIVLLLVFLGLGLLVFLGWQETTHLPQRTYASSEIADAMVETPAGLALGAAHTPEEWMDGYAWAMVLDDTGNIRWNYALPDALNHAYTTGEVAGFARWYLDDYPVFCWAEDYGLFVIGLARGSLWKCSIYTSPEYILNLAKTIPLGFGLLLLLAAICCFLLSWQGAKRLETAADVREMSTTAKIILAASFASVLLEPLNCLPFFVHLWGVDSGTGKTVALMVAASVWGDPAVGAYVKTFDGTVVGMEKTAAFLNNLPFCLDELQLAKDSKGRTTFDVYKLAQGVGRTRGNRSGGVDLTPTWRNCILTTGESPLTGTASGAGAVNRGIDIECKSAQAVIKDGMRISGAVKRNYGFAGRKFVERLYQPGVIDQVSERYRELFRILSDRDTTEKQAMAAAAIILADELACQWIFSGQQPLTIEQVSEFLASKAAVSAGDRGYKYLCDWVTQNSNKLCGRSENPNIEVLGALEDGRAYIIRSVFERILQDAGYSTAAMISYLKQSNLIETRGRANTKGKRINGIPTECFCLRLPSVELDDEADPDEQPL